MTDEQKIRMPKRVAIGGMTVAFLAAVVGVASGNWSLAWAAILSVAGVAEAHGVLSEAEGDTLSEQTRSWWHTKTPVGRWAFTALWGVFAVAFGGHIAGVVWL